LRDIPVKFRYDSLIV